MEVGEIVMCVVDRIVGTSVFVKILGGKEEIEGTITLSEIAPGRIRNLRDYVFPKKQIICKILRIEGSHIELSLRRVSQKEQKDLKEKYNQERSLKNIIKTIVGESSEKIISELEKNGSIFDFFQEIKSDPAKLQKLVGKEKAEKIIEIVNKQKVKKAELKKEFKITTIKSNGLELIKKVLSYIKNAEIKYIAGGNYTISTESEDIKKADSKLREDLEKIRELSKKEGLEFSIKEK